MTARVRRGLLRAPLRLDGLLLLDAEGGCELLLDGAFARRPGRETRAAGNATRAARRDRLRKRRAPRRAGLDAPVLGSWTMLPAGHEILDRLWDTIRLEAALGGELYECSAKLYARHRHRRSLTSHGTVLAGAGGRFFRPVVASFTLSHFEAT